MRVLVTEKLSDAGLDLLRKDFEVDVRPELAAEGLRRGDRALRRARRPVATQVTSDVIEAGDNLKVVARAGIGLDNVDVDAATRRGVMVVNAPSSNIVSAAEHTIALLLAQARNIPQAHADLQQGRLGPREVAGRRARRARRSASSGSGASARSSRSAASRSGCA